MDTDDPVTDPGFSRGGCANTQIGIILQIFCRPWRPTLDPPMRPFYTLDPLELFETICLKYSFPNLCMSVGSQLL